MNTGRSPSSRHSPLTRNAAPGTKLLRVSHLRRLRECEKVAAVCYRVRPKGIEFLLVQTRNRRWTFPKGGTEPGLTHAQAAALEGDASELREVSREERAIVSRLAAEAGAEHPRSAALQEAIAERAFARRQDVLRGA